MFEFIFHSDLIGLIKSASYLGLFAIIFAESGLLVGFFLPGDSLLFTAGFLASQEFLDIRVLCVSVFSGAVLGDTVGYWIGRKLGPRVFNRPDSLIFHHSHVEKTKYFFEKHGGKTIIMARFMPVVRTFAPVLAGVGKMNYRTFLVYNIVGGALWALGLPLIGYFLGNTIPGIEHYLTPIIIGIILLSLAPTFIHVAKDPELRQRFLSLFKQSLQKLRIIKKSAPKTEV